MCLLSFFLGHLRFSVACHAAGYPSGVPHLADSGWLTYSCGDGLAWGWGCLSTDVLFPLGFLPCACTASPSAVSPSGFLHPWRVRQHVWLQFGGLLPGLGWRVLCCATWFSPCAVLFLRACSMRCFPCCRFPYGFLVTGCLSFCFPGDVDWA